MTRRVPKPAQEDSSYEEQEKEVQDLLVAEELGNSEDAPNSVNIFKSLTLCTVSPFVPTCQLQVTHRIFGFAPGTNVSVIPQMSYRAPDSTNCLTELHF